jgi:two-component system OmpR family response regulator
MAKILLLEDDPVLGKALSLQLELSGHQILWQKSLSQFKLDQIYSEIDLWILDLNLSDGSGLNFCQEIRNWEALHKKIRKPIIILTAKTDENSVVIGFKMGASDYVKKPFSQLELNARIQSLLQEPIRHQEILKYGPILIQLDQQKILIEDKEVKLNRREFNIFVFLTKNVEKIISRETILNALACDEDITDRTIDSHLSHIRSKLKKLEIHQVLLTSIYGQGYKLEIPCF